MQRDLLHYLPLEILQTIFSYFQACDAIECMLTCHEWHDHVPTLSPNPWQKLFFVSGRSMQAPASPFNEYIETVCFSKYSNTNEICTRLRSLVRWGCANIHTLLFNACDLKDQERFAATLKGTLGGDLRALVFEDSLSDLAFLSVLVACPQLEALCYQMDQETNVDGGYETDALDLDLVTQTHFEMLDYLSIDCTLPQDITCGILERAPNLRYVCLNYVDLQCHHNTSDSMSDVEWSSDIKMIVDNCPRVESIICNHLSPMNGGIKQQNETYLQRMPAITTEVIDSQQSASRGLRVLKLFELNPCMEDGYNYDDLIDILRRNQETLEVLHLGGCHLEIDLDGLSMPNLRELSCRSIVYCTISPRWTFLSHCTALETLELTVSLHSLSCPNLPTAIASLESLKTLMFKAPDFIFDPFTDDYQVQPRNDDICNILRALGSSDGCHLQVLIFGTHGDGCVLTDNLLDSASAIDTLRDVQLHCYEEGMSEVDFYLEDTANVNSSKAFTAVGLSRFLRCMHQLERLWISNMILRDCMFDNLGSMESLQELRITDCSPVNEARLQLLTGQKIPSTPFRSLIIDGCELHRLPDVYQSSGFHRAIKRGDADDLLRLVRSTQ
ncbi:hypothetical protein BJV82DRAFT_632039 [Fennellomyces sp. T-0311]|nr:hypothetical protein BJV82DRAFT_632039 [Fennellomyces sp. T-0311]